MPQVEGLIRQPAERFGLPEAIYAEAHVEQADGPARDGHPGVGAPGADARWSPKCCLEARSQGAGRSSEVVWRQPEME
ncbi:MAG: hypothetical protein OXH99_05545 [Bryobacterales bacterium]|nr:hypothetical protein [Bryobacterales bacterium]